MKAILMTAIGSSEILDYREIPEPEITSPRQIKVKLAAAGINPVDTKIRRKGLFFDQPLPAVLGCDGAGTVVEAGAEVTRFIPGDKVCYYPGGLGREQGNYVEFNVLDERWASMMPKTLSFTQAAALPLVLITAWGALYDRGGLHSGQTVLIHAGAGGVGHVAVQLAKRIGAKVITTVSSPEKADFVKALGANDVILYTNTDVAAAVNDLTQGKGADLVLDTVGGDVLNKSVDLTAHFGRLITLLAMEDIDFTEARLRNLLIGFELMLTPMLRDLDEARDKHVAILNECADMLDKGLLQTHVSQIFPLAEAGNAHRSLEQGHVTGKLVLAI